ncbi:hypothetical protein Dimus_008831 [Dionaea muscipula]
MQRRGMPSVGDWETDRGIGGIGALPGKDIASASQPKSQQRRDRWLGVDQCLTFVYKATYRPTGIYDHHDDEIHRQISCEVQILHGIDHNGVAVSLP